MDRVRLSAICEKHKHKKAKECDKDSYDLALIERELNSYFDTAEGREALAKAPRSMLVTVDGNNEVMMHETTKALAIRLILAEFGGGG